MIRAVFFWLFFATQIGTFCALMIGVWFMARIDKKLDRDHLDKNMIREFLLHQSNAAVQNGSDPC